MVIWNVYSMLKRMDAPAHKNDLMMSFFKAYFRYFLFVILQTKKDNRTKFCWFLPNIGMSIGSKVHIFDSEKLGEGSYGAVYRCSDEHGKAYAVKCIKTNEMGIPNILENSIMMTISHPALNTALHIHTTARETHIFQRLAKTHQIIKIARRHPIHMERNRQLH